MRQARADVWLQPPPRVVAAPFTYGCSLDQTYGEPMVSGCIAMRQAKALSKADVVADEEETSMCAHCGRPYDASPGGNPGGNPGGSPMHLGCNPTYQQLRILRPPLRQQGCPQEPPARMPAQARCGRGIRNQGEEALGQARRST